MQMDDLISIDLCKKKIFPSGLISQLITLATVLRPQEPDLPRPHVLTSAIFICLISGGV